MEYQQSEYAESNHEDYYDESGEIHHKIYRISSDINILLQVVTIIANIFHLIVLFRKELRCGAIYILMIGIAISDISSFIVDFYRAGVERFWWTTLIVFNSFCVRIEYTGFNLMEQMIESLNQLTRPGAIWLAVIMALIRTLSVSFPMSNWIQSLTRARSAVWMVVGVFGFWTVFYARYYVYVRVVWYPDVLDRNCLYFQQHKSIRQYVLVMDHEKYNEFFADSTTEPFVRMVPAVCYPILTLALLIQLRFIKKKRGELKIKNSLSDRSDKTTKLILMMTACFMLSEGPSGLSAWLTDRAVANFDGGSGMSMEEQDAYSEYITLLGTLQYVFLNLRIFNALTHPFCCFFMSSQYRDTVEKMFCVKKRKKKFTTIKVSSASVTSLQSTSDRSSKRSH